ncbi:MAG: hypothetical protein ACRYF4_13335 [Janthinobacterium lividum]
MRYSEFCQSPSGTFLDLPYFLQKPGFLKRLPYLFVVSKRSGVPVSSLQPQDIAGTVLLLEYRLGCIGTKAFATNDRSGSGTLLARTEDRSQVAALICGVLMGRGARVALLSFTGTEVDDAGIEPAFRDLGRRARGVQWALRHRQLPAFLPLQQTLDETLAGLGQKTRSNMRYYRRRAEKELGCTPVLQVVATPEDMLAFNSVCMYPIARGTLLWRLRVLDAMHEPFLIGLKDREGQWLSVLAGRRFGDTSEILWQLNRAGHPAHSLGTVMRSYCMEQEIARGAKRLQVEGGTFHSMHHSFMQEELVDLVVVRSGLYRPLRKFVSRYITAENSLADMLKSDALQWYEA